MFTSRVKKRLCVCGDSFEQQKLETLYITTNWVKIIDDEGLSPLF